MSVSGKNLIKETRYKSKIEFEHIQMKSFGIRYVEYRNQFERANNLEYLSDFPLYIMLEQTYRCNLRCPSCIHGYKKVVKEYYPNGKIMPLNLYKKILAESEANNLCSISMMVNDEPLLLKDIAYRINLARSSNVMDIIMVTNGNLMTKKIAREIIEAGVTHILFSVDAVTEETYSKVRPNGNMEKVLKAIDYVNEIRKGRQFPIVRASFFQSALNEHEQKQFQEYFKDKVDYIDIQKFTAYRDLNLHLKSKRAKYGNKISCCMPWTRLSIRLNGDVMPCCTFYGYDIIAGNVYKQSIKDIWHSEIMCKLREDAKRKEYTLKSCRDCINCSAY